MPQTTMIIGRPRSFQREEKTMKERFLKLQRRKEKLEKLEDDVNCAVQRVTLKALFNFYGFDSYSYNENTKIISVYGYGDSYHDEFPLEYLDYSDVELEKIKEQRKKDAEDKRNEIKKQEELKELARLTKKQEELKELARLTKKYKGESHD